ncbi:hypothetical protein P153DRAFT_435691 [Dothidotthia symphoricarpi CBS 119687]|uniref:DUF7924 domain-containing protein n=1 Tax=Dothidotthia symphoricarpi CBS 119687 TaxID=1392245 RepID=A0A6A5ZVG6_9PLEO|nr:uncharacterized protein P153DRAFT_435691 [Dothidotthia symphoricarpi CBS 119687]KAF2123722.1 hypothetical protein P153DRAFT_435691 [Dothidotthia symphoricarpi CBS 119687]
MYGSTCLSADQLAELYLYAHDLLREQFVNGEIPDSICGRPDKTGRVCESQAKPQLPHKRRRISLSEASSSSRRLGPCQHPLAPRTPESDPIDEHAPSRAVNEQEQEQRVWSARAQSIFDWAHDVAASGDMPDRASQRRAHKASLRARSASPTKKSPEYRQNGMARAHVYVDHVFDPPADIDALRCYILGDGYMTALEGIPAEMRDRVGDVANEYMHHCRELARDAKGEAEWKSALLEGPFRRLIRLLGRDSLATSASDKPWRPELKPRPPTLRDLLSFSTPRLDPTSSLPATAPAGFNFTSPPPPTDPSETTTTATKSTTLSTNDPDPSSPLTTPKPDIFVGLARPSFNEIHQLVQQGLHFPFLLVEAKGLTASGNMMGAENQAAVGGACAINILEALQRIEPDFRPSRIVFSISTEGPLHQLFIHYHIDGRYHMVVHRAWRVTLQRDCTEFVIALARIIQWGAGEFCSPCLPSHSRSSPQLVARSPQPAVPSRYAQSNNLTPFDWEQSHDHLKFALIRPGCNPQPTTLRPNAVAHTEHKSLQLTACMSHVASRISRIAAHNRNHLLNMSAANMRSTHFLTAAIETQYASALRPILSSNFPWSMNGAGSL